MALSKSEMLAMIEASRAKKATAAITTTDSMKEDNTMKASTTTTEAKKSAAAITTTEAKNAAVFSFTSKRVYVKGEDSDSAYEIMRYGFDKDMSVYAFANIDGLGVRFHIGVSHEQYSEAKKAAEAFAIFKASEDKAAAPKKAAAAITTTTTDSMKEDNTMKASTTTTEAKKAAAAKKAAPKKAAKTLAEYIKTGINGSGWRFIFDEAASRTRLIFEAAPSEKQLAAISEAGFYYSKQMDSYNKKLTMKAAAAAEELAKKL